MTDALSVYLRDHLAGSSSAIALLSRAVIRHGHSDIGDLLRLLLIEIRADQRTLESLVKACGASGHSMRRAAAAVAGAVFEIGSRRRTARQDRFGLFETLEVLGLGVLGKRSLWRALRAIADAHPVIARLDLDDLEERADRQFDQIELLRLAVASTSLLPDAALTAAAPPSDTRLPS